MTSTAPPSLPVSTHHLGAAVLLALWLSLFGGFVRAVLHAPPSTVIVVTAPFVNASPTMP